MLVPVFFTALVVSALPAAHSLPGSFRSTILSAEIETQDSVQSHQGVRVVPDDGAILTQEEEGFVLEKGGALLSSQGAFSITTAGIKAMGLTGAFHIIRGSKNLTISALTTPVFVADGDQRMVVPVGFRWEYSLSEPMAALSDGYTLWNASRTVVTLPQHFVEEQMGKIEQIQEDLPVVAELPEPRTESLFLLRGAEQIAREAWDAQLLGALRGAVESEDQAQLQMILTDPAYQETLATDEGIRVQTLLLSRAKGTVQMELMNTLMQSEVLWMLASLHPLYRDAAWTFENPNDTAESTLVRLLLFPNLDGSTESVERFAFDRWSQAVKEASLHVEEPIDLLERFFQAHLPIVARTKERGYPERAEMLLEHLRNLFEGQDTTRISDTVKADLVSLQIGDSSLPTETETVTPLQAVEDIQKLSAVVLNDQEIVSRTYRLLRDAGALFTVETEVKAVGNNQAQVTSILFGGATQDRMVSFVLDAEKGEVSNVTLEGKTYPFTSAFEEFVTWMKR